MSIKPLRYFFVACLALGWASLAAHADIIVSPTFDPSNQAAPPDAVDYEGNFYDGTAAPYDITIGTFGNFSIPTGYEVAGATISGTFGDQNINLSALADLFVLDGGIEIAGCDDSTALCATGPSDGSSVPWSYTFSASDLNYLAPDFAAGSVDFTAVQNSFGAVIVGTPSLDIQLAQTPEPASFLTLAGGLLALAGLRRRK